MGLRGPFKWQHILQGHSVVADLLKVSDCTRTIEEAAAKMGGLDILVRPTRHICGPTQSEHPVMFFYQSTLLSLEGSAL